MDKVAEIIEAAKHLRALKDKKAELEEALKEVNKEKERLETKTLPDMMEAQEIDKMTIDGVGTLYTQAGVYAYIYASDRDMAFDWFKRHGHEDIVKEQIHFKTLTSWVKDQMSQGQEVPEWCNAKPTVTARIRSK